MSEGCQEVGLRSTSLAAMRQNLAGPEEAVGDMRIWTRARLLSREFEGGSARKLSSKVEEEDL